MKRTAITYAPTAFLWNRRSSSTARNKEWLGTKGFTLLEILIAMMILAVTISLVFSSFNGIFSSAEHVNASTDLFEMGNACISRITKDLKSIHALPYPRYRPPDIDDDPDLYRVEGEPLSASGKRVAKLRFASLAHLPLNHTQQEGIAEVVYYVQEDQDRGLSLHRSDKRYPYPDFEPNPYDPVVCEQLVAFELTYFDHEGEARDEWNSDDQEVDYNTPSAIGIKLALGPEASPMIFSTRVSLPTFRYQQKKR